LGLTPAGVIDGLLDPGIRVGTSTPGLDPGGDYAWELFERIGAVRAAAAERLKAKAILLVGDPALPLPPKEYLKHQVLWHLEEGRADVFPVYRTTALLATQQADWVELIELPAALRVSAEYGLSLVTGAKPEAARLQAFILGPQGQAVLRGCGFNPPQISRKMPWASSMRPLKLMALVWRRM
jgi:ABC-type molybdate transport system substrate-binding protein